MADSLVEKIGLIAGAGRFPHLVLAGAQRQGLRVVVVGLRGLADPQLLRQADAGYWSGVARVGRWIRVLRREGVRHAVLAGSVRKADMYGRYRVLRYLPDWTGVRIWFFQTADKRNDSVLRATADALRRAGIELQPCVAYCRETLAPPGVLTRRGPTAAQRADIALGWRVARRLGELDVGQSVIVREGEVIAVEAVEGTDRMIARAAGLCPMGGWSLVKVAKPDQDMRFDVPTIGPQTVAMVHRFGGRAVAIEAGKTVVVDLPAVVELADRLGVRIVSLTEAEAVAEGSAAGRPTTAPL